MDLAAAADSVARASVSVLKSANEQPNLAGELIRVTVASLMQMEDRVTLGTTQFAVPVQTISGGAIIDTTA